MWELLGPLAALMHSDSRGRWPHDAAEQVASSRWRACRDGGMRDGGMVRTQEGMLAVLDTVTS